MRRGGIHNSGVDGVWPRHTGSNSWTITQLKLETKLFSKIEKGRREENPKARTERIDSKKKLL